MSSIRSDQVGGRIVDNTEEVPGTRAPLVLNMDTFGQVTNAVSKVSEAVGHDTSGYDTSGYDTSGNDSLDMATYIIVAITVSAVSAASFLPPILPDEVSYYFSRRYRAVSIDPRVPQGTVVADTHTIGTQYWSLKALSQRAVAAAGPGISAGAAIAVHSKHYHALRVTPCLAYRR